MRSVQIIRNNNVPAYAVWVLPYDEYKKLSVQLDHEKKGEPIPHEVVSYMIDNNCTIVKAWRIFLKKSQKTMAAAMGITQGTYSAIENSRTNHKATLAKLSSALGITVGQMDVYE